MAIGLCEAGFAPAHFFEADSSCCRTLQYNIDSKEPTLQGKVHEGDIRTVDWRPFVGRVRLLSGGVPCQPFSLGGKHLAERDPRNLFSETLRAIREIRPASVLIENVRGLLRANFQPYFEYVIRQLQVPSLEPKRDESWKDHDQRIKRYQYGLNYVPEYHVTWRLLDAADFGVPQNRHRVFVVATRVGLPTYTFPQPTHSREALLRGKLSSKNGTGHLALYEHCSPWMTVKQALDGLQPPCVCECSESLNHWVIPGARIYPGHQGSVLDWPSKTIKAGVHGVPGGENVLTGISIMASRQWRVYTR